MADDTAKAMLGVVDGASEISVLADKIALASNQQTNAANQIMESVEQISSVVQTNSATAEESAAASEELSGQAQMLQALVSRVKLKTDVDTMAAHVKDELVTYEVEEFSVE